MSAVRVKICGLVHDQDADMVNGLLPDYVGLVFASSKRQLSLARGKVLAARLDSRILRVGVFADNPQELILAAVEACSLDILQLHGSETPGDLARLLASLKSIGRPEVVLWKTIGIPAEGQARPPILDIAATALPYEALASAYLLDATAPAAMERVQAGGHGRRIDWQAASAIAVQLSLPIVLAGGLNPGNVAEAISTVLPAVVDVSSGTETNGCKDPEKIRTFIQNAKEERHAATKHRSKDRGTLR